MFFTIQLSDNVNNVNNFYNVRLQIIDRHLKLLQIIYQINILQ